MIIEKIAEDVYGNRVSALGQWDSDIYVYLSDPGITTNHNVDFCNASSKMSYVMNSTFSNGKLKVKIPNALLQQPYIIVGFIIVELDDGTRTMYRFRINVIAKPIPSDYIGVDTADYVSSQLMLDEMRTALGEILSAKAEAMESIVAVKDEAEATMAALKSTSVQFNFGTYDDGNGNVTIVASVVH